ncbi:MAG: competence/damage-inducible protein A [candidate division Zixibacteria bacterium]|nr:competence/damage-inducible protein A [candidate division Zixibacteria bacterium]
MNAEIITIGDEILLGHTVDTNSAFISRQLSAIGFEVTHKSVVSDKLEAMEEAFRIALRRSKVTIATGGLGPTDDDRTKRAIVKVFKRNLILDDDILDTLKNRWASRGQEMPALSQNQALLPQGATFFPNQIGSAVGICITEQERVFIALPGVPIEMRHLMTEQVRPYLAKMKIDQAMSIVTLRTTGIGEVILSEKIQPNMKLEPGLKLAYLPTFGQVDLRVVSTAQHQTEADEKAERLVRYIEKAVGKHIYGRDDDTLTGVIGQLLKDNDKTLAVAESCTAGQLGMAITDVAGASSYFVGGLLAYANDVKTAQLGVAEQILIDHGAVSEECALAMAIGCRKLFGTDYTLSITGIAGPDGGTDEKPVGTVYVGLASAHTTMARLFKFGNDRTSNRTLAVNSAMEMLRREILDICN